MIVRTVWIVKIRLLFECRSLCVEDKGEYGNKLAIVRKLDQ